jgi:uncharacterized protein YigA (DUF484 family)
MTDHDENIARAIDADALAGDDGEADRVEDYLLRHPDFFVARGELLRGLTAPPRWGGATVVDLHRYQVESLRGEMEGLRDCASEVIETSRANLAIQSRTHAAVLALVAAPDLEALLHVISEDLPIVLGVDVAVLAVERGLSVSPLVAGVRHCPTGAADTLLGEGRDVRLLRHFGDDGTLFGAAAGLVRSAALARLACGPIAPAGILAFGSRADGGFHPKQGTELLRFLAKVVEVCLYRLIPAQA